MSHYSTDKFNYFWICEPLARCAKRGSSLPLGTPMEINFTSSYLHYPLPQCSKIVTPIIFSISYELLRLPSAKIPQDYQLLRTFVWKSWPGTMGYFLIRCNFFFTLVQQRLSKAYAINCSCFATGAQNTLYKQKKKERTKINHLWPHFIVILNSPVQFCPFPVYPGWQSHTCDPLVLMQFASSWQEWFPLHSSMSMKSQMKKWDFKIMQKLLCISHYCVKECKPWLFLTFCWIARTRDCRTWWKKLVYAKTSK